MTLGRIDYEDFISAKEASEILGRSKFTLKGWRLAKPEPIHLSFYRDFSGRRTYYSRREVLAFKEANAPVFVKAAERSES